MEILNKKDCPTAFHYNYLTHSCVVLVDKELSWDEAKINCETNLTSAGQLLEIKNSDVQMWVDNLRADEGGKAMKIMGLWFLSQPFIFLGKGILLFITSASIIRLLRKIHSFYLLLSASKPGLTY